MREQQVPELVGDGTHAPAATCKAIEPEISRALYDEVCAELAGLLATSRHRAFWEALRREADAGEAIRVGRFRYPESLLAQPRVRDLLDRRATAMAPPGDRAGGKSAVGELLDLTRAFSPARLAALDAILWRALNPFDALSLMFAEDHLPSGISPRRRLCDERPLDIALPPQAGKPMDYTGYACVIVKATRRCNLRCSYCHDWRDSLSPMMAIDVQEALFRSLFQTASFSVVDVVWHGGEPTLMGRARMEKAFFLQRMYCDGKHVIRNTVQTNGTLIDEDWIRFFRRFRVRVGVSVDGPAGVHDTTRRGPHGQPSFALVSRGIRLLAESGLLSGLIMVATAALVGAGAAAIVDFLEETGVRDASILPVRPGQDDAAADNMLSSSSYVSFLIAIERERRRRGGSAPRIREIENARLAVSGAAAPHCELLGNCIGAFFSVEPDGSVWHCDKFNGDETYRLGNVQTDDFQSMQQGAAAFQLRRNLAITLENFAGCQFRSLCQGWCPHEHYVAERFGAGCKSCCGLAPLFAFLGADRASLP